jgi:hypothetical protein
VPSVFGLRNTAGTIDGKEAKTALGFIPP